MQSRSLYLKQAVSLHAFSSEEGENHPSSLAELQTSVSPNCLPFKCSPFPPLPGVWSRIHAGRHHLREGLRSRGAPAAPRCYLLL